MKSFKDLGIESGVANGLKGEKIKIKKVLGETIEVHRYEIKESKYYKGEDCLWLQIKYKGEDRVMFTSSTFLMDTIRKTTYPDDYPFKTTIIEDNDRYLFTEPKEENV